MTFPVTIHFGTIHITLHAVTETLAFFVGFRYFLLLRKAQGDIYSSSSRIWAIIGAIFGALIGSRLIGSLERPFELLQTDNFLNYIYSNKTIVGGLLGGLFGVELTKRFIREKKSSGDLFVYPIILALIIGRIGCFSMGIYEETYGIETRLPWGMNLGDGIPRHPIMLYEILFLVLLWITLRQTEKRKALERGALFKLFMISYLVFRFLIDFIKPHYPVILQLNTIQLTCIAGLLYYAPFILRPKKLIANYA